jgi:hypothetical protein
VKDCLLQDSGLAVQEGGSQSGLVAETAEQGAFADAGSSRDLVHGHSLNALFGEELACGFQYCGPVA